MTDIYTDPNTDLVMAIQQSNGESAFETLYDSYSAVLFGVIYRIIPDHTESENILQDCFVKIWKNIRQYNPEKGKLSTWMINIARHTAIDFSRTAYHKQKSNIQVAKDSGILTKQLIVNPPESESEQLKLMVDKLSPDCREIIERMYFEGYTQQEISDTFGIPLGTVKTRSRMALKELRTYFNQYKQESLEKI